MNQGRVSIFILGSDNLLKITEIEKRSFDDPWKEDDIAHELQNSLVLGFNVNSILGGYVIIRTLIDEGEILRIAVLPEYRRMGYAGKLLASAIETVLEKGCTRLFLEVRTSNLSAISLYKSAGFSQIGIRRSYYSNGEDALLLQKKLK